MGRGDGMQHSDSPEDPDELELSSLELDELEDVSDEPSLELELLDPESESESESEDDEEEEDDDDDEASFFFFRFFFAGSPVGAGRSPGSSSEGSRKRGRFCGRQT